MVQPFKLKYKLRLVRPGPEFGGLPTLQLAGANALHL